MKPQQTGLPLMGLAFLAMAVAGVGYAGVNTSSPIDPAPARAISEAPAALGGAAATRTAELANRAARESRA